MKIPCICLKFLPFLLAVALSAFVMSTGCVQNSQIMKTANGEQTPRMTTVQTTIPATPPPAQTATKATTGMIQYTSTRYGFSIDYPADWQGATIDTPNTPPVPGIRVVEFYSPSIERCNSERTKCVFVRSEVSVDVDSDPGTDEVADYFVRDTARITSGQGIAITKRNALFKLSGVKAYRLDYNSHSDKEDINVLRAYTIISNRAYIIHYHAHFPKTGEEDQFVKYYNTVMDMFTSFKASGTNITI